MDRSSLRPYPETKASYPLQVYNHGGFGGINGALGPAGNDTTTDELGLCLNAANNGWIGAAPSYRGEGVHVKNAQGNNAFPPITSPAQGQFEFCLGEVTDSIALVNHFLSLWSVIYHGRVPELVPQIIRNEVLMWGWSHGGCVTQRAVQQGGPVNAAATFSAMADDPAYYNWCVLENPVYTAQGKSVRCDSTKWPEMHGPDGSTPLVLPNAYNWRSSVWFESVDVGYGSLAPRRYANEGSSTGPVGLKAHPNVPVLMLQGGQDQWIPTDMACNLAANLGSSCSTWYYGKTPWVPGGSLDPNQALETHCANLPWQLLVADAGVAAVENWTANSNLVWLDDDDHTNDPNRHIRGILNDVESWHNFRAFVHQLGWGVEVATTTFVPQDAPVPQVLVP
jgi:hypothetical protein